MAEGNILEINRRTPEYLCYSVLYEVFVGFKNLWYEV